MTRQIRPCFNDLGQIIDHNGCRLIYGINRLWYTGGTRRVIQTVGALTLAVRVLTRFTYEILTLSVNCLRLVCIMSTLFFRFES